MPGFEFWRWSDPDDLRKQQARDFIETARQTREDADRAELQQHVGGIIENFQSDVARRMEPLTNAARSYMPSAATPQSPQTSPVDDVLSSFKAGAQRVGEAAKGLGDAANTAFDTVAPAVKPALDLIGTTDVWDQRHRQWEMNKAAVDQGYMFGAMDPRYAREHPDEAAEFNDIGVQQMAGSVLGAGGGVVKGAVNAAGKFVPHAADTIVRGTAQKAVAASYGNATPSIGLGLTGIETLATKLFDDLTPLGKAADALSETLGRKLGFSEDAYKLARMGRATKDMAGEWYTQHVGPALAPDNLKATSGSVKQGMADLNDYLRAADAVDKAAAVGNPTRNFGGMNAATAQQAIDEISQRLGPERFAQLEASAKQFHDFGHWLLEKKVDAGMVTRDVADQLRQQYPRYMPINVIDHLDALGTQSTAGPLGRAGGAVNDIKRLTEEGTARSAEAPVEAYMRQADRTAYLVARQEVGNAVVETASRVPWLTGLLNPADDLAAQKIGMAPTGKYGKKAPNEFELKVFDNGQVATYWADKALEPLVNLSMNTGDGALYQLGARPANWVRKASIGYNPVWGLGQLMMDSLTYLVREGGITNPGAIRHLGTGFNEAGLNPLKGFAKGALRDEAAAAGALPGTIEHMTGKPGSYGRIVDELTGQVTHPQRFANWIKGINERFDAAPRLAEYAKQKAEGAGIRDAALAARDVTIDPSRGGKWTRDINTVVPFFNVAWQGAAYTPRLLTSKDPTQRNRAALGIVSSVMAPAALLELSNQQDPRYADVPEFDKRRGLVIMAPWKTGSDPMTGHAKPDYFLIRTGPFTPFVLLAREMTNRVTGNGGDLLKLGAGMIKSSSPIDASGMLESAAAGHDPIKAGMSVAMDFAPTALRVPAEAAFNYDTFRDRPIVPAGLENGPPEQQFSERTSETSKLIGQMLGLSPARLDHLLTAWGGAAQAGVGAIDEALKLTGVAEKAGSQRAQKLQRDLNKTGLDDAERARLEGELAREQAITEDRKSSFQNRPVVGGLVSKLVGYREGGGQSIDDRAANVDRALLDKRREKGPVATELKRLGVTFGDVKDEIAGIKLTREMGAAYREKALTYREKVLDDLVKSELYRNADDKDRGRLVQGAMSQAAGWAAHDVARGNPALAQRLDEQGTVGAAFVAPQIDGNVDVATKRYLSALKAQSDLDEIKGNERFRNVAAKDYQETAGDVAMLQKFKQIMPDGQAEMVFQARYGAERLGRALSAKPSRFWQARMDAFRRDNPDYGLFIESAPQTFTRKGLDSTTVAKMAGL